MGLRKATEGGLRRVAPREYARDLEGLCLQLQDPDPTVRRWAVRDLGHVAQVAPTLCEHLHHETDHAVREMIFTTLRREGSPEVAAGLMPLLRSEDANLRNSAIEVLSSMPQAMGPHVERLLDDPDADVRIFTLNVLNELRHPDVMRWVSGALQRDPHVNVVAAALEVAAESGTTAALPFIEQARQRFPDDAFIGFAADMAQQRIEAS
ncbi:HEAT repeat domain-containing protein [Aquabacterium sp. A3]|uniref:HEAT repeat domain-containing protein n=1 Tax=Aquabacterium sp. A3 TaxID=3132829 RepID=UPI00311965C5